MNAIICYYVVAFCRRAHLLTHALGKDAKGAIERLLCRHRLWVPSFVLVSLVCMHLTQVHDKDAKGAIDWGTDKHHECYPFTLLLLRIVGLALGKIWTLSLYFCCCCPWSYCQVERKYLPACHWHVRWCWHVCKGGTRWYADAKMFEIIVWTSMERLAWVYLGWSTSM